MNRILATIFLLTASASCLAATADDRPNIVLIMVDELGYYEPGFMGGKTIETPRLDRMAAEGFVFRNLFAGSSACAPTRCSLLTGKHTGHSTIRGNGGIHSANKHPTTGVEYRGTKRTVYEGGLRIPFVARWPGKIGAGQFSDFLGYFPDMLPTIAEAAGTTPPKNCDGISLIPELIGAEAARREQPKHEFLYWEYGGGQAVRKGNWRAVKADQKSQWELSDLATDPSESSDVSASHPDILKELMQHATAAHQPVSVGTFERTDLHERDRKAKYGRQDRTDWEFRWPKKNKH